MATHYLLALGFLLSIISGSLAETAKTEAKTSADLTDAELEVFQKHFANVVYTGDFTCENYVRKCGDINTPSGKVCQEIIRKLTCDNLTNLEGTKQVLKTVEVFDPKFVATSLDELTVINKQN